MDLSKPRCYSQPEVRELLQLSRSAFHRLLNEGKLPWVEEIKPRAGRPRYLCAPLDRYLRGEWQRPAMVFGGKRPR